MKMHLNLATRNLDASVAFYSTLLGSGPTKRLADYALFVTNDPALELALDADPAAEGARGVHFGIVVDAVDAVDAQLARLQAAGFRTDLERETTCCYASQSKVWASDPDGRRWETYVVHADSEERDDDETTCCRTDGATVAGAACCT